MLFKDNFSSNWWATLHLKDIFISSAWVTLWNMAMTPDRFYRLVAFEWMLEGCTHQDWLWDHLFWSSNVHFTAWIWVMNIIDDANAFLHDMIWQAGRNPWRRTLSLQRWAFYCKLWDACLDDLAVLWRLMITYLKGMFQLEASSWLIDHLNECWHDAHNQSEDNSQKNPGEKILHDESSNTTLGGQSQAW